MKKLKLFLFTILILSGFVYGQNTNKEDPPPKPTQVYMYRVYDNVQEAFRVIITSDATAQDTIIVVSSDSTVVKNEVLFSNPYKPYTPLDTVVAITNTAADLATLLGYDWNLRGGLLELINYDVGKRIAHGSSDIGFGAGSSGHVLYFGDTYRDEYSFYPSASSCYVISDSTNAYVRIRLIGR